MRYIKDMDGLFHARGILVAPRMAFAIALGLFVATAARAEYWIEYTEEWRSANARMIAEGVMPERIGPFSSREDADAALAEMAGASGTSDGVSWRSCMGDYLYVAGGEAGGSSGGGYSAGSDQDWAAYYAAQAEARRLAEEARRRAEEEDRRRAREREAQFTATHSGALGQVQGRPWQGGESGGTNVDLPPVSLGAASSASGSASARSRIDTTALGNLVLRTVQVPVPLPGAGGWRGGDRLPEDDEPIVRLWLSPQAAALLGTIGRSIRNAPVKFGEVVIGALGGEAYLNILKVNKALADDAVASTDEALGLIRRGYPEPETARFLRDREMRSLRVVVGNISDIPMPEDEAALEADGRRWFRWLTRGRGR